MAAQSPWSTVVGDAHGRLTVITSRQALCFALTAPPPPSNTLLFLLFILTIITSHLAPHFAPSSPILRYAKGNPHISQNRQ